MKSVMWNVMCKIDEMSIIKFDYLYRGSIHDIGCYPFYVNIPPGI